MSNESGKHLKSLTGLRFAAALVVFVGHVLLEFPLIGSNDHTRRVLGASGVCFFYVLSGFILTYVYASRPEPISIREFYVKRIARIWPLHLVTLLIVLFCVVTLRHQLGRENGLAQIVANFFLLQSWWPDYGWVFSINGPSWSLSNEAFFYLMFPWLATGGAVAFRKRFFALGIVSATVMVGLSLAPANVVSAETIGCLLYANPLVRLFDFMTGMACGFVFIASRNRTADSKLDHGTHQPIFSNLLHLFALLIGVIYVAIVQYFSAGSDDQLELSRNVAVIWLSYGGAAVPFALTVFAFARHSSWISKLFSSQALVYLGEISFAFYLIHQAIITLLSRQALADSQYAMWWMAASSLLLSLATAMLLHHLIELPSRAGLIQFASRKRSDVSLIGRLASWLAEYGAATRQLVSKPRIVLVTGLAMAGFWCLDAGRFDFRDPAAMDRIVSQTPAEYRDVRFEQDAVLKGLEVSPQLDGSYQLRMVWDLKNGRRPIRFIHICDSKGEILRHGDANRSLFEHATGNEIVLDRVTVARDQLESAASLLIGFYCPERKSARIANRLPGQATHRLQILQLKLDEAGATARR